MRVKRKSEKTITYMHHLFYNDLIPGNFFGRRGILTQQDSDLSDYRFDVNAKSRLTIIAATPYVKFFTIKPKELSFVPEFIQRIFKNGLLRIPDYDEQDIKKVEAEYK